MRDREVAASSEEARGAVTPWAELSSDEKAAAVRRHAAEGHSGTVIAERVGAPSRNAVASVASQRGIKIGTRREAVRRV